MREHLISIRQQRARYVVTDWVTTAIAFFLFNISRYIILDMRENIDISIGDFLSMQKIIIEQILVPTILLGVHWLSGYYNNPYFKSRWEEFQLTLSASLINSILIFFSLLINDPLPTRALTYELFALLWGCMFIVTYIGRLLITSSTIRHFEHRDWCFNTIVIGDSDEAVNTARRLERNQSKLGYRIIGHLHLDDEKSSEIPHKLIPESELKDYVDTHQVDQLIFVPEKGSSENKILNLLFRYFNIGVPIKIAPTFMAFLTSNIRLGDIIAEPFIDLTSPVMKDWQINAKRVCDVMLSSVAMVILSPIFLALSIGVKLSSPGPVLYRQERIGYLQKPFNIYKFRSMRTDAEADGPQLSTDNDPRITPIGKIMRKYRLDEFPQFWNVLKGDMSIVGPRPEREFYIRQIVKQAPYYTLVHQVKPGITSWGMVKFGYAKNVAEMVMRTRYDLIYISNMSLAVDFKIMLHTVRTVFTGKGV